MKSFLFGFRARLAEVNVPCGLALCAAGVRLEQGMDSEEGTGSEAAQGRTSKPWSISEGRVKMGGER